MPIRISIRMAIAVRMSIPIRMSVPIPIRMRRRILSTSLQERLKDRLRLLEVVVHDVDEEVRVHEVRDEAARGRVGLVVFGPLAAEFVGFVLLTSTFPWISVVQETKDREEVEGRKRDAPSSP